MVNANHRIYEAELQKLAEKSETKEGEMEVLSKRSALAVDPVKKATTWTPVELYPTSKPEKNPMEGSSTLKVTDKLDRVTKSIRGRKGLCVICGDRVNQDEDYIESEEGYCHKGCIFEERTSEPAQA